MKPVLGAGVSALSPDGSEVLYTQEINGHYQIFKINVNSGVRTQLTHVEGPFRRTNSGGDWFDPAYALPVSPQPELLSTTWGKLKNGEFPMVESDVQLIYRILSGDEAAFTALVRKYQKGVHALAWRKVGDFHIAEEITQDTFLQVHKKLTTLQNPNQFAGVVICNYGSDVH